MHRTHRGTIREVDVRQGGELRARFLLIMSALVCSFCLLRVPAFANQPNIVLIYADDAGFNELGFNSALHGNTTNFETPNLDALAQQSVVLSNAYVSSPVCSASRAGLLTGQYQQRFGWEANISGFLTDTEGLTADQRLMSHHLRDLDYSTGAIGKWHQGTVNGVNRPLDMGFDEFFGALSGGRNYWGGDTHEAKVIRRGNTNIESQWTSEGDPSLYDPERGRYLTDAFGEEAVDFIDRHAGDDNPFFLYLPFTAPHGPHQAKEQDRTRFSHITDVTERLLVAMTFAMDRAVGDVLSALDANGLNENTIVVFVNDNGGSPSHDNSPLRGFKGSTWEGGIRVPFTIRAPGLQPGISDAPITTLDLLPTLVAAAGGDVARLDTDGVDLMPFLSGSEPGDPHEVMHWRHTPGWGGAWAIRKGEWKLVRSDDTGFHLYDLASDIGETTDLQADHPDIVDELLWELTIWEAQLDKPRWGTLGADDRNQFDHFVLRQSSVSTRYWSSANAWREAGTENVVTMRREDAYANARLEFTTRDDGDYTAINNLERGTRQTFMLNQMILDGSFAGASDQQATIRGKPLLFAQSRDGVGSKLQLNATSPGSDARFAFFIDNELQLLHDLEVTGDGTQDFVIRGGIRDYYESRNVAKTGTSDLTLSGANAFTGTFTINGGDVTVTGPAASIDGASAIVIGGAGRLAFEEGAITVGTIDNSSGGLFDFSGGRLSVANVVGDLVNDGGILAPGNSSGTTAITGDFSQSSGTLAIELGGLVPGESFDQLAVSGAATLGGTLDISMIGDGAGLFLPDVGSTFEIVTAADGISARFEDELLPEIIGDSFVDWAVHYGSNEVALEVLSLSPASDFDLDGTVDGGDFLIWQTGFGTSSGASHSEGDADGDGDVDGDDFLVWQRQFGRDTGRGAAAVPEPASLLLLAALATLITGRGIGR